MFFSVKTCRSLKTDLCINYGYNFKENFMQYNNEEIFMPYMSERKLGNMFRTTPEFKQNKELQDKIITWAKEMLSEARNEWTELRKDTLNAVIKVHHHKKACKGAIERDKKYAKFRAQFAEIQKEYFIRTNQNGQNLTANSFVDWFEVNKPKDLIIPYVKHNQNNKLRQLAQANNRKFKKLLLGKSAF